MKVEVPEYAVQDEIYVEPARTALVVVDMQNDFVEQGGSLLVPDAEASSRRDYTPAGAGPDERNARRLQPGHTPPGRPRMGNLARALSRGQLGVGDRRRADAGCRRVVLRKIRYDAFYGTPLDHLLRLWGIETLVICGTIANFSVQYTAASAALRRYAVVIPRTPSQRSNHSISRFAAPDRLSPAPDS